MEQKEGKTLLITGATAGIGLEIARGLLEKGFRVLGTYRSEEKRDKAMADLGCFPDSGNCRFFKTDLSSRKSLESLAREVEACLDSKENPGGSNLDVLINNGGTFFSRFTRSDDGVEMQTAVNALAPLYLGWLLRDRLARSRGRIINATSSSHYGARPILWDDLQLENHYSQLRSYRQTKLFSIMLSERWNALIPEVPVYMADPGLVKTDMGYKNTGGLARFVWKYRLILKRAQNPARGARTALLLACSEAPPSLPGEFYWKYEKVSSPSSKALDVRANQKLWEYACDICGIL